MAGNISMGFAGPQHPVYGFDPKNVAASLTSSNWRRKAVLRGDRHGLLYVWVGKGTKDGDKKVVYVVDVKRLEGEGGRDYHRVFGTLEDALRYANGEDGSAFSRNTGKVILNERGARLLTAKPAPAVVSVWGLGHRIGIPGRGEGEGVGKPDGYACFLTKVLESILAVSPGMSKHVYQHGITLHPDVEGRKDYGPNSDLPERITVRCYKSENEVAARFHVFPKVRAARGLMKAVRIVDPKGKAKGKGRAAEKKASRKPGPRS